MTNPVAAKHLALFAENPRRYCAGELRRSDLLDDDIPPGWRGRGLALGLAAAGGLALPGAAAAGFYAAPLAGAGAAATGLLALGASGWLAWRAHRAPLRAAEEIHRLFNLDPGRYSLRNADILGNRGRVFRNDRVLGVPHALFDYRADTRTAHVGMLVASKLPEEGLPDRDLYRLTLHMGLAREKLKLDRISGSIRYADRVLRITHSDSLYRALLKLVPEFGAGVTRGTVSDGRSLRVRWQHHTQRRQAAALVDPPSSPDWPQSYLV